MTQLDFDSVQWCSDHGHPFLILHTDDHSRHMVVAIAIDDAQALAAMPGQTGTVRNHELIEAMMAQLGATLSSVQLTFGHDRVLRARLHVAHAGRGFTLPAHFADGVALAQRGKAPLWMSEHDLALTPTPHGSAELDHHGGIPDPFRRVIDSLDL